MFRAVNYIVKKAYEVFQQQRNIVQYFPYVLETLEDLACSLDVVILQEKP